MTTQVTGSGVNFNGSTSGTILLTQPAIAGSNTLTLPAETGILRSTVSSGTVLQIKNYQTGAVATGSTITTPRNDNIPQNTSGDQYMSLAITPQSATSKLQIDVVFNYDLNANNLVQTMLFQDSTANALASVITWVGSATVEGQALFSHTMTSGTTSSTTFKVRAGGASGTLTFNGLSGVRESGGVYASGITITEYVP